MTGYYVMYKTGCDKSFYVPEVDDENWVDCPFCSSCDLDRVAKLSRSEL